MIKFKYLKIDGLWEGSTIKLESEIFFSWKRCIKSGLSRNLSIPRSILPPKKINQLLTEYDPLISIFEDSVDIIKNALVNNYLFLMTDKTGILLAQQGFIEIKNEMFSFPIGTSFAERSYGTNAISLAMRLNKPIVLLAHQHFSNYLKLISCYSLPLVINEETISYLMVSSIKNIINPETIALTQLLKERIISNFDTRHNPLKDKKIILNEKQKIILDLLAQGMTTQAIALALKISSNTVKYHKKNLFRILNVQSTSAAITKAIRYQVIKP